MNDQKNQHRRFMKPKTVHFIGKKYIKNTCTIKNINIKIREHHSRTRKPRKTNFGKKGPCTPNQCYGDAFGVLRRVSLYK